MTNKIQTGTPEEAGQKQDGRFRPGASGNPAGRPKGARSKLGEQFIQALADDFELHGASAIARVREKDPTAFLKIISATLPREVLVKAFTASANIDLSAMADAQGRLAAYKFAWDFIGSLLIEAKPIEAEECAS